MVLPSFRDQPCEALRALREEHHTEGTEVTEVKKPAGTGQKRRRARHKSLGPRNRSNIDTWFSAAVCAHGRKISAHQFDPGSPLRVWGLDPRYLTCPLIPVRPLIPVHCCFILYVRRGTTRVALRICTISPR